MAIILVSTTRARRSGGGRFLFGRLRANDRAMRAGGLLRIVRDPLPGYSFHGNGEIRHNPLCISPVFYNEAGSALGLKPWTRGAAHRASAAFYPARFGSLWGVRTVVARRRGST